MDIKMVLFIEYFYYNILLPNLINGSGIGISYNDIKHCNKILGININGYNGKEFYMDMFLKNYKSYLIDMDNKIEYCQKRMKEEYESK
jgi:hypothetical protein